MGIAEAAALQLTVPLLDVAADPATRKIAVRCGALTSARLADLRRASAAYQEGHPGWTVELRLDGRPLPSVRFPRGGTSLDAAGAAFLDDVVWALQASGTRSARVTGYSDTSGTSAATNRRLALRRAQAVAQVLQDSGIDVAVAVDYPVRGAARMEQETGREQFRRADIVPVAN